MHCCIAEAVWSDLQQIWRNCRAFNVKGSLVANLGEQAAAVLQERWASAGLSQPEKPSKSRPKVAQTAPGPSPIPSQAPKEQRGKGPAPEVVSDRPTRRGRSDPNQQLESLETVAAAPNHAADGSAPSGKAKKSQTGRRAQQPNLIIDADESKPEQDASGDTLEGSHPQGANVGASKRRGRSRHEPSDTAPDVPDANQKGPPGSRQSGPRERTHRGKDAASARAAGGDPSSAAAKAPAENDGSGRMTAKGAGKRKRSNEASEAAAAGGADDQAPAPPRSTRQSPRTAADAAPPSGGGAAAAGPASRSKSKPKLSGQAQDEKIHSDAAKITDESAQKSPPAGNVQAGKKSGGGRASGIPSAKPAAAVEGKRRKPPLVPRRSGRSQPISQDANAAVLQDAHDSNGDVPISQAVAPVDKKSGRGRKPASSAQPDSKAQDEEIQDDGQAGPSKRPSRGRSAAATATAAPSRSASPSPTGRASKPSRRASKEASPEVQQPRRSSRASTVEASQEAGPLEADDSKAAPVSRPWKRRKQGQAVSTEVPAEASQEAGQAPAPLAAAAAGNENVETGTRKGGRRGRGTSLSRSEPMQDATATATEAAETAADGRRSRSSSRLPDK